MVDFCAERGLYMETHTLSTSLHKYAGVAWGLNGVEVKSMIDRSGVGKKNNVALCARYEGQ